MTATAECDWCGDEHAKSDGHAIVSAGREWRLCSEACVDAWREWRHGGME